MKFPALVAALALAPSAFAADWYVDAVGGSDSGSGTTSADAWRTITFGLGQIPTTGPDTVHVLPGLYDTAHGERFPLALRSDLTLLGMGARDAIVIDGPPSPGVGTWLSTMTVVNATGVAIENLSLEGGSTVVRIGSFAGSSAQSIALRDVRVTDANTGVLAVAAGFGSSTDVALERVEIADCTSGIELYNCGGALLTELTATDCAVTDCVNYGILAEGFEGFDLNVTLDRCRLLRHSGPSGAAAILLRSITAFGAGEIHFDATSCLIARSDAGIVNDKAFVCANYCTIVDNPGAGVRELAPHPSGAPATLAGSILYGNGDDVDGGFALSSCNVGDGDQQGANGNISVDPLFRDPTNANYRLGFTTGCVDAIPGASGQDLEGFERGNDGDLDLAGAGDMGAFELRTLDMPGTLAIGDKLHVDYHAEVGRFGTLFLARTVQLPAPLSTPFGLQWLPQGSIEMVGTQKVLTSNPVRRTIPIPDLPGLVGQSFSFQALSRSSAAPQGAAWTDAATVTFTL